MAFLTQTMNAFTQTPILGLVDLIPSPSVFAAMFNPASTGVLQVGSVVKLITGPSGLPLVDVCSGPTDGPVAGVVPYNERKNIYVPGDIINLLGLSSYVYLKTSAAVARGDKVTTTSATLTADPTVATVSSPTTQYVTGVAIDVASAANQLIRVRIYPSFNGGV